MKFSIRNFFSKCDHIRSSHLLKKSSMKNFIFCAVKIVFDPVAELHCEFHRTSLKRGRSDIDFPDWMESKKKYHKF